MITVTAVLLYTTVGMLTAKLLVNDGRLPYSSVVGYVVVTFTWPIVWVADSLRSRR